MAQAPSVSTGAAVLDTLEELAEVATGAAVLDEAAGEVVTGISIDAALEDETTEETTADELELTTVCRVVGAEEVLLVTTLAAVLDAATEEDAAAVLDGAAVEEAAAAVVETADTLADPSPMAVVRSPLST